MKFLSLSISEVIQAIFLVGCSFWSLDALAQEPATSHKVEVDGHVFAVWEKRPESKPSAVVLLLHGRTWSSIPDFDLQVEGEDLSLMDGLTARGYVVYALDARGYGATPRDQTGWLTPNRAAKDSAGVLKWVAARHEELAPPVLFGWSMGSMVAQLCVQENGELVSGVVLFGYPIDPRDPISWAPAPGEPARKKTTARGAASDFIVPDSISQNAIDAYVVACLKSDPVRVDWNESHQWKSLDPKKIKVPLLLIQGEFDPIASTSGHARFFTQLGTADRQWVVIPDADHAAFMETNRPLFLHELSGFVDRWKPCSK